MITASIAIIGGLICINANNILDWRQARENKRYDKQRKIKIQEEIKKLDVLNLSPAEKEFSIASLKSDRFLGLNSFEDVVDYFSEENRAMREARREADFAPIRKLLDAGADLNSNNDKFNTPLLIASRHNDILMAKKLLDAGADLQTKKEEKTGIPDSITKFLIDAGKDLQTTLNNNVSDTPNTDEKRKIRYEDNFDMMNMLKKIVANPQSYNSGIHRDQIDKLAKDTYEPER